MNKSFFLGLLLLMASSDAFAYCDPYSSNYATCVMNETSEALSREEIDPYDYIPERVDPPEPTHTDNADFMLDYCMREGFRAGLCK